jgi:hypothetical protein
MKVLRFDNFNEGLKSGWTDFGSPDFPPGQGPGCNNFYGNSAINFNHEEINKIKSELKLIVKSSRTTHSRHIEILKLFNSEDNAFICDVYKYEDEWFIVQYNRHRLRRDQHIYIADQLEDVINNIKENI